VSAVLLPSTMSVNEWFDFFHPIANTREQIGISIDDIYFCLDTNGSDMDKVRQALILNPDLVWTVVEVEDGWYLVNGYCKVNAIYYVICDVPQTSNAFYETPLDD
jgi:hypothetical protein